MQTNVEEPIKLVTADKSQSYSLGTWIHYCAHLSSLLVVGEQWCWCKYVYLLYAAGMYDKGDQVCYKFLFCLQLFDPSSPMIFLHIESMNDCSCIGI